MPARPVLGGCGSAPENSAVRPVVRCRAYVKDDLRRSPVNSTVSTSLSATEIVRSPFCCERTSEIGPFVFSRPRTLPCFLAPTRIPEWFGLHWELANANVQPLFGGRDERNSERADNAIPGFVAQDRSIGHHANCKRNSKSSGKSNSGDKRLPSAVLSSVCSQVSLPSVRKVQSLEGGPQLLRSRAFAKSRSNGCKTRSI